MVWIVYSMYFLCMVFPCDAPLDQQSGSPDWEICMCKHDHHKILCVSLARILLFFCRDMLFQYWIVHPLPNDEIEEVGQFEFHHTHYLLFLFPFFLVQISVDALESLRQSCEFVCPNDGFLEQVTNDDLILWSRTLLNKVWAAKITMCQADNMIICFLCYCS